MANKNRTGFYPVGTLTGAPWSASIRRFVANCVGANVCKGALVELDALGKAKIATASSSNILGAIVGIEPVARTTTSVQGTSLALERTYFPADTTGTVYVRVCTDPWAIYETVTGNGTTIVAANIGENFHILTTAGGQQSPATTPQGASVLDLGDPQLSVASQLVLLDIPEQASNDTTAANAKVLVLINDHVFKVKAATAG